MRTRLAIERAGTVTPHLKRGAPVLYPNPNGNGEKWIGRTYGAKALVLDPTLALIEWGASLKQMVLMTLLVNTFFPFGLSPGWNVFGIATGLGFYLLKLLIICCLIVLVETTNAKMRLFRVPELLAVAFILGALALISTFLF